MSKRRLEQLDSTDMWHTMLRHKPQSEVTQSKKLTLPGKILRGIAGILLLLVSGWLICYCIQNRNTGGFFVTAMFIAFGLYALIPLLVEWCAWKQALRGAPEKPSGDETPDLSKK